MVSSFEKKIRCQFGLPFSRSAGSLGKDFCTYTHMCILATKLFDMPRWFYCRLSWAHGGLICEAPSMRFLANSLPEHWAKHASRTCFLLQGWIRAACARSKQASANLPQPLVRQKLRNLHPQSSVQNNGRTSINFRPFHEDDHSCCNMVGLPVQP